MKKYPIKFDGKKEDYLNTVIKSYYTPPKTKMKAKVILLRMKRHSINSIIEETKLSKRTIINYTNKYLEKGNFSLFQNNYRKNKSQLTDYESIIINDFEKAPPKTHKEAVARIEQLTGIKRSETQIRKFLQSKSIYTDRSRKPTPKRRYY